FSPDGKAVKAVCEAGINVWDVATGRHLPRPKGPAPNYGYCSIVFSPDGKTLVGGARAQAFEVWDAATGKSLWRKSFVNAGRDPGSRVAFSPEGRMPATGGEDGLIRLWDPVAHKEIRHFDARQGNLYKLAFAPDGKTLASGGSGSVRFWDPVTGRELR